MMSTLLLGGSSRPELPWAPVWWLLCHVACTGHRGRVLRLGASLDTAQQCPFSCLSDVPTLPHLTLLSSRLCPTLQVYHLRTLALAFIELTVVQRFHKHTHGPDVPPALQAVLGRLSALYALWSLSQHTALLYQGEAAPVTCPPGT